MRTQCIKQDHRPRRSTIKPHPPSPPPPACPPPALPSQNANARASAQRSYEPHTSNSRPRPSLSPGAARCSAQRSLDLQAPSSNLQAPSFTPSARESQAAASRGPPRPPAHDGGSPADGATPASARARGTCPGLHVLAAAPSGLRGSAAWASWRPAVVIAAVVVRVWGEGGGEERGRARALRAGWALAWGEATARVRASCGSLRPSAGCAHPAHGGEDK